MSKALARRETGKIWEVTCWRCQGVIGTMDGPTLSRALVATAHKEGVLCPDCRRRSCPQCGVELRPEMADKTLCWFCFNEEVDAIRELTNNIELVS